MKKYRLLSLIAGIALIFAGISCSRFDDFKLDRLSTDMELHPSIAMPLAYGSFDMGDVLEAIDSTGRVEQETDSLLFIFYADTAYSVVASELITLPNKITSETYIESDITSSGAWDLLPDNNDMTFYKTENLDFQIEPGDQIDSVLLSAGILNIIVSSQFKHPGILNISSPVIFDEDGDTLNLTFPISELDGSYYSDTNYDMSAYKFEIQEVAGMAVLRINFNLTLTKQPAIPVTPGETAGIQMSFESMSFSHVYGFVAEREVLNVSQTIDIPFYEAVASMLDVYFKDPQLNIKVRNSYGIPIEIDLSQIIANSTYNGTTTPLVFKNDTMTPFKIKAPAVTQLGQTLITERRINAVTSNIDDILASAPDEIDFSIIANTGSAPGGDQNFVLDTSKMTIEAELKLPMWFKTEGYTLERNQYLNIDSIVTSISALGYIDSVNLQLKTINELPLDINLQVYFLDENMSVIDSMFGGVKPLLVSSPVDTDGELVRSLLQEYIFDISMTNQKLEKLNNTKHLTIKANASTSDEGQTYVKIFSNYLLHYSLSLEAELSIDPAELLPNDVP